jgi:regulator of protease activity HflC (stomatin/prohibitin superfamily)
MNIHETDSIDGKEFWMQIRILASHILCLLLSWHAIKYFQYLLIVLAGKKYTAQEYIETSQYLPLTFLIWGFLWVYIFINRKLGWFNPTGNQIQASYNAFVHRKLPSGGTQYIIHDTGFGLAYLWQFAEKAPLEVEKETVLECPQTTITIKKTSLNIKLSIMYRVWLQGLSHYLQNGLDEKGEPTEVLKQIKATANQLTEVRACDEDDTETVRKNQSKIIEDILPELKMAGERMGLEILDVKFAMCDYDSDTQKELNKILEAQSVEEIAKSMGFDPKEKARAYELAAVIAGKAGAKLGREITEIVMDPNTADAIKSAGPAAAALLLAFFQNKGKAPK